MEKSFLHRHALPNLHKRTKLRHHLGNEGVNCACSSAQSESASAVSTTTSNGMENSSKLLFCASKSLRLHQKQVCLCSYCSWSRSRRLLEAWPRSSWQHPLLVKAIMTQQYMLSQQSPPKTPETFPTTPEKKVAFPIKCHQGAVNIT